MQLDRHTPNQRTGAYDVGSVKTSLEFHKARAHTRYTAVIGYAVNGLDTEHICKANTFAQ